MVIGKLLGRASSEDKNRFKRLPQQKDTTKSSFTIGRLFRSRSSSELVFFMEDQVHGLEEQQDPNYGRWETTEV